MNITRPPLLVTGAHRSGTTWVGKMLAASGAYAYASEPLNIHHRPGVMRTPTTHWYTYICNDNEAQYLPALRETTQLRYHLLRELLSLRSVHDTGRMIRDAGQFWGGRLQGRAALLKDPFAVFSVGWFVERLGCQAVIVVRHPAAFASSLKRLDWTFKFHNLLEQPLLMRDHLEPFRADLEAALASEDLILRACTLWRVIYHVVRSFRDSSPDLHIVRHMDLSLGPLAGFETLYGQLGLPFTPATAERIRKATSADNPQEVSRKAIYNTNLDSRANLKNWQKRLSEDEIARIRELTEDVAAHFYSAEDW